MNKAGGLPLIKNLVKNVFPIVDDFLANIKHRASLINDNTLRLLAISSIEKKKFHCQGGCAYALYPNTVVTDTVRFIVAFQTISDYLDNLCDRAGVYNEKSFRILHMAMCDAVDPETSIHDYYSCYPYNDDGGYLVNLVDECRELIRKLPSMDTVIGKMKLLVSYYTDLQTYKHIEPNRREEKLASWAAPLAMKYPGLSVWEFCAAAGSTLGIFLLFAAGQDPSLSDNEAAAMFEAYFPWVCSLHILLDYYIDAEEDKNEGDFNFTEFYRDTGMCGHKLSLFTERALSKCASIPSPGFHKTVIQGLLAVYLSDPKATSKRNRKTSKFILKHGGSRAVLYHGICNTLRRLGKL